MNFEHSFTRTLNGSGVALGSDAALVTGSNVTLAPQNSPNSAYGAYKCQTQASGIAPKNLLISVIGPAAANAMSANIFVWNEKSTQWVLWAANVACANGTVTSVAMPAPALQRGGTQSIEYFVAFANVATSNGSYQFDICPGL